MTGPTETLSPALPRDIETLAMRVLQMATANDLRIATAESCTGGLLASLLTDVEGCGHCFERGFVTYTEISKAEMLGVPQSVLEKDGAVSRRAAQAMAEGAIGHSSADLAISITGYAGPGAPGEEEGLVYIAASRRGGRTVVEEHHFGSRGRGEIRLRCLRAALEAVTGLLQDAQPSG